MYSCSYAVGSFPKVCSYSYFVILQLKSLHERQAELLELQRNADAAEEQVTPVPTNGYPPTVQNNSYRQAIHGVDNSRVSDEDKDKDEREEEEEVG